MGLRLQSALASAIRRCGKAMTFAHTSPWITLRNGFIVGEATRTMLIQRLADLIEKLEVGGVEPRQLTGEAIKPRGEVDGVEAGPLAVLSPIVVDDGLDAIWPEQIAERLKVVELQSGLTASRWP